MMADGPRRSSTLRPAQNIRPPPDVPGPRILSVVEGHRLLDRGLVERIVIHRVSRFWIAKGDAEQHLVHGIDAKDLPRRACEEAQQCLGHAPEPMGFKRQKQRLRSEEHTSELQSLMRNSYAVFCLK